MAGVFKVTTFSFFQHNYTCARRRWWKSGSREKIYTYITTCIPKLEGACLGLGLGGEWMILFGVFYIHLCSGT